MDLIELKDIVSSRHPWEQARLKIIFDIFRRYTSAEDVSVLDIGCGDVYVAEGFVNQFKVRNYFAVDSAFDDEIIEVFASRLGQKNTSNISLFRDISEIKNTSISSVDCIFLFDVIEHIQNDVIFLKELLRSEFVTEDTKIFITVPAYNSLFTSHDVFLKHYRRYNDKMITKLASEANFDIIGMGNFFSVLIIPRIFKLIYERVSRNDNYINKGIGDWKSNKTIDRVIVFLLYFDYTLSRLLSRIGIRLPGLSKFVICKKSV